LNDCTVLWHPSGHHFFAASRSRGTTIEPPDRNFFDQLPFAEIVSVSRETWSRSFSLTDDSVSGVITALALSQNGVYLASATRSHVHVWSTQTRQLLFRYPYTTKFIYDLTRESHQAKWPTICEDHAVGLFANSKPYCLDRY
jgi:chromosome transmission fidelity protein 4